MFETRSNFKNSHFYIRTCKGQPKFKYLHCDGRVIDVCEYFESREAAQKVLDKYYPKPKHEWKHGDVFRFCVNHDFGVMVYIKIVDLEPKVFYIDKAIKAYKSTNYYLENAKFLFNIREKLCQHQQ